jgi:hypothetical protein
MGRARPARGLDLRSKHDPDPQLGWALSDLWRARNCVLMYTSLPDSRSLSSVLDTRQILFYTRQRLFVEYKKTLVKETLCRVTKTKHSVKSIFVNCSFLPRIFCLALDKMFIC